MDNDCSCGYYSILSGLRFATVVIFILQMIVVILAKDSINCEIIKSSALSGKSFDEYFNNYNEIDIKCAEEFFKKLDNEKRYYDISQIVVRVLCSILMALAAGLFLNSIAMCCCEVKFYSFFFVVPIYGFICNIITIGLINKAQIKCECQIEGFDEEINKLLMSQYTDINVTNTVICSFTIIFDIFCLILLLCLKCKENITKANNATTIIIPIAPIPHEIPQVNQRSHQNKKPYANMVQTTNSFSVKM